jgi:anionic cell wall polymer biosynthesis LytR-Cps2A-Psr (LCP) family protein
MNWFWKKPKAGSDAEAALRYAEQSHCQAQTDLDRMERGLRRSQAVKRKLKEHNTANHYDDWLCEQFLKYYSDSSTSGE